MTNGNDEHNVDLDEVYELFKKEFEKVHGRPLAKDQSKQLHVRVMQHCIESVISDVTIWLWDKNLDFDDLEAQIDDAFGEDNWVHMAIDGTETNTDMWDHYMRSIIDLTVKELFEI